MFKGIDKRELLGYIEGAKQFVRYMGRTGIELESTNEAKPKLQSFKFKFKCMECGKSFIKSLRRSLEVKCPKCKSVDIELENVNVSGEIIKEARDEKVYLLNGMLWLSHSPNSGETTRVRGRGFITDKRGDKNYDSSVSKFAKWASKNKPIKKKRTKTGSRLSLFKIGEYSRSDGDAKQYDIWGGEVKPRKWWYLLVSQGKINVITIFDSKGEAMSWIGHSEDVSVDENLLFGESVNEAAIGKVGIGFFIDQLTNAMDHYNEREFVSHLNRELEIDKKVLKRVWKNYLKVSPRYKTKWLPRNWEKWLERQGIVESVNEGADYSKVPTKKLVKTYKQMADERLSSSAALTFRLIAKELIKRKAKLEGTCGYAPEGKVDVHNTDKLTPAGPHLLKKQKKKVESMNEKVIKVSKKDNIPGNPMKMKGEEKIKKLVYSGSIKNKGSYEIKGNKLNVNNIRPRDKGFFVRHFTMGTGFRKANLYYDGVHWQGKKEF
jgi:phage FluMu protein Com